MTFCTDVENIKKSRKVHPCSWCAQKIDIGDSYMRYRHYDGGDAGTVKMHPECLKACDEFVALEGQSIEFFPGDNPRGCYCGFDEHCSFCKDVEEG